MCYLLHSVTLHTRSGYFPIFYYQDYCEQGTWCKQDNLALLPTGRWRNGFRHINCSFLIHIPHARQRVPRQLGWHRETQMSWASLPKATVCCCCSPFYHLGNVYTGVLADVRVVSTACDTETQSGATLDTQVRNNSFRKAKYRYIVT